MPADTDLTATVATYSGVDSGPDPGDTWLMKYTNLTATTVAIFINPGVWIGPFTFTKPLTVTGTVTISGNLASNPPATNETILIGIDTSLVDLATLNLANIAYMDEASLADGTPTYAYSITGVPAGTYYLAGAIDIDGNSVIGSGDYAFIYGGLNPGNPADPLDDPPANVLIDETHTVFDFTLPKLP